MGFLTSVCITAVATALFRLLVPENKMSKQLSLLIACVFLLTGITAVTGASFDIQDSVEIGENADFIRFSEQVDEKMKIEICRKTEEKIRALLEENGLFPEEVHVIVNISGLYGIDISEVKVFFSGEEQADFARSVLEKALSGDIKVTVNQR